MICINLKTVGYQKLQQQQQQKSVLFDVRNLRSFEA
jgi:hypothetical protein